MLELFNNHFKFHFGYENVPVIPDLCHIGLSESAGTVAIVKDFRKCALNWFVKMGILNLSLSP